MRPQKIIPLFILIILPLGVKAQLFDHYRIGIAGNRSNIIANSIDNFRSYRSGVGIGLHAEKAISKNFNFSSGLEISMFRYGWEHHVMITGPNGTPTGETYGDETTSSLFLLSIPALVKFKAPAKFSLFAGPRFDFELSSRQGTLDYMAGDYIIKEKDQLSDHSEFFVAGWTLGIGKGFSIFGYNPSIEFRFNGDFQNLIRENDFIDMKKRRFDIWVTFPLD